MCPLFNQAGQLLRYVTGDDLAACSGKGICNGKTGTCECTRGFQGQSCETAAAVSTAKTGPEFQKCPGVNDAMSSNFCDRTSGKWTCTKGSGKLCQAAGRKDEVEVDWTRSMDKWGWSLCPEGSLLIGMKRAKEGLTQSSDVAGDALYSIDTAKCAKPKENPVQKCYHQNWWTTMNSQGGAFCQRNYFVAGLFRSHCNSLYCLEMAKCCQVKRSVWEGCKWTSIESWKRAGIYAEVEGKGSFVAGFYRTQQHTLDGLTKFRECSPRSFGDFS
jgi:hypothetical protein